MAAKKPIIMKAVEVESREEQLQLSEIGRFALRWIPAQDQMDGFYFGNIYGYSGANGNASHFRKNECLLRMIFRCLSKLGDAPICLCGDLSVDPDNSAVLQAALATNKWKDLGLEFAKKSR